jgi:hypothetical protein
MRVVSETSPAEVARRQGIEKLEWALRQLEARKSIGRGRSKAAEKW